MSQPNTSWEPSDIAEEDESVFDSPKALEEVSYQPQEEDDEQGAACSGLWNLSDSKSEPMVQDTPRKPLGALDQQNLFYSPSTSAAFAENSRDMHPPSAPRGARSRYRSSGRVTFGVTRGQRGQSSSRQEFTRGSRSRGRSGPPQPRVEQARARGRSHSLEHRRTPSPQNIFDPETEGHMYDMMNNFHLLCMTARTDPEDSYTP